MFNNSSYSRFWLLCGLAAAGLGLISTNARSQGYAVGEDQPGAAAANAAAANAAAGSTDNSGAGPVRMARFSLIQGNVTWRADESIDWAPAPNNLPLKQGAQIWVANGGRAEVQFDDGSYLRLGGGAIATIQVLFSDTEGEFTELKLTGGLAMLRIRHERSVYQVDTPLVSVKAGGPARIRLGVSDGVEVGVPEGAATVEGPHGKVTMKAGDYLGLPDANAPFDVVALPNADSWETWNAERDQLLDGTAQSLARHNVPENVTLVAGDLDAYGTWRADPTYGQVWCPRVLDATWRPYYAGHWVWVNPFGWTWCSDEPWGWAPYHYGTWVHAVYGWGWCPGPVNQYWCPAVVHFSECNGNIAWCALAPSEVHYPATFAVGFAGGNWAGFFSIGMAGCYYPAGGAFCVGRPFSTVYVNRTTYITNVVGGRTPALGFAANNNTYAAAAFVPINARSAAGVTATSAATFGGRGSFTPLTAGSTALFTQGRAIGAPPVGRAPAGGPPAVRPTAAALTSGRGFVRSASQTSPEANRQVFHSAIPAHPVQAFASSGSALRGGTTGARNGSGSSTSAGSGSNPQSGGRNGSSAAEAAAAARRALGGGSSNGGSSTGGTIGGGRPTGGGSSTGGSTTGGGSVGGHPTGSGSPGGNGGGYTGGHYGGGSPSGGSSTGGHSNGGGSTSGGGGSTNGGKSSGGSSSKNP